MQNWESGSHLPEPQAGKKLAALFGITLADLIDLDHTTCLLADLRTPTGLSQAEAAHALGWTTALLGRTERGERIPTPAEQHTLATLYHVGCGLIAAAAHRTAIARAATLTATLSS